MVGDRTNAGIARDRAAKNLRDSHSVEQLQSVVATIGVDVAAAATSVDLATAVSAIDATVGAKADAVHAHVGADLTTYVLENRTSDPGTPELGRIWFRTDTDVVRVNTGAGIKTLVVI